MNKIINKIKYVLGLILYWQCILLNVTLLFLKSLKIKVLYSEFFKICESKVVSYF